MKEKEMTLGKAARIVGAEKLLKLRFACESKEEYEEKEKAVNDVIHPIMESLYKQNGGMPGMPGMGDNAADPLA